MERKLPLVLKPRLKRIAKWAHHRSIAWRALQLQCLLGSQPGTMGKFLNLQSLDFLNSKMDINGILFIKIAVTR